MLDDDVGRVVDEGLRTLSSAVNPLRAGDLPPMADEDFWRELRDIERDVEYGIRDRFGSAYVDHLDPFRMHISELVKDEQESITGRIDRLSGLHGLLQGERAGPVGPVMFRDYRRRGRLDRSPAGRMPIAAEEFAGGHVDPRLLQISQQTIRFDRARSDLLSEQYFSSGTQYRPHVLRHVQRQLEEGIRTPGKTLIFDVETPGLNPEEGIWQVSARMLGENRQVLEDQTFHFANPKMKWGGAIGPQGQRLEDFLSGGKIGDYPEQMKQFLKMVEEAETVGGHNIFFDYGMLAQGLKKNLAYRNDAEYKRLTDAFLLKFYNKEAGTIGNVIDTNVLARNLIPNISLARELTGSDTPYQFSLQNILLQTDLLQRIKASEGDKVSQLLSRGLHYADVDVPFEAHLMQALQEHQQFLRGQGGRELRMGDYLTADERRAILRSRAIGPSINMTKLSQVHPSLQHRALQAGLIELDEEGHLQNIRLTPMEQMVALQRNLAMTGRASEPYRTAVEFEGNAFQKLKHALWDVETPTESTLEYGKQVGMWDRMSSNWRTQGGLIAQAGHYPTDVDWRLAQEEFAKQGVPFAGLSWLERHVASTLGETGTFGATRKERDLREIFGADAVSLGRFVAPAHGLGLAGQSEIATIPISYLEEWERNRLAAGEEVATAFTRPLEKPQFLYLSPFRHTEKSKDEVALMLALPEEEKESLLSFLTAHPDVGPDSDLLTRLRRSFRNNTGTYGIQVGTLGGVRGGEEPSRVAGVLRQLAGRDVDKSDQTPMFWTSYAGRNLLGDEGSIYTAGAFMKPELLSAEEMAAIPRGAETMIQRYRSLNEGIEQGRMTSFFRSMKQRGVAGEEGATRMYRTMQVIGKRGPVIAAGVAAAAGGYYLYRRSKRNELYDETMAVQPVEASGWYQRNQANEMPTNPRVRPDYLQTAKIVRNLDANKINHTSMAPNKYDYLYQTGV